MIVQRFTFVTHRGRSWEAARVAKKIGLLSGGKVRVYKAVFGTGDRIAIEWESDSVAGAQKTYEDLRASPQFDAMDQEFCAITQSPYVREVWEVVE